MNNRFVRRDTTHQLRGSRLVAAFALVSDLDPTETTFIGAKTSNKYHSIAWLCSDHLLSVHAHQVSEEHACWTRKTLMETNGGKVDSETSIKLHPSLDSFDQLRDVSMTLTYQLP